MFSLSCCQQLWLRPPNEATYLYFYQSIESLYFQNLGSKWNSSRNLKKYNSWSDIMLQAKKDILQAISIRINIHPKQIYELY